MDDCQNDAAPDLDVEPEQQHEPELLPLAPCAGEPDARIGDDMKAEAQQRAGAENGDDPAKGDHVAVTPIR
jgi:hypothetical protein